MFFQSWIRSRKYEHPDFLLPLQILLSEKRKILHNFRFTDSLLRNLTKELFLMQQSKFRKSLVVLLIPMITLISFANCFGKFAIVKKVYDVNESFNIGSGLLAKIIKTLVMYFPFSILYAVGFFFDIILFNLIEFWSGSNPVGYNEYDQDGKFVKTFENQGEKLTLTYSNFGSRLDLQVEKEGKTQFLSTLRSEPGKFFVEKDGKLEEIAVSAETIGSKTILKMAEQGKLKSTKVIETKTLNELEAKLTAEAL